MERKIRKIDTINNSLARLSEKGEDEREGAR
jgi:hypothetical protein